MKAKPGIYNQEVYMYDINSSYPYSATFNLPFGSNLKSKPEGDYIEFCLTNNSQYKHLIDTHDELSEYD
jgi:Tol biopolymer transport system component